METIVVLFAVIPRTLVSPHFKNNIDNSQFMLTNNMNTKHIFTRLNVFQSESNFVSPREN